MLFVPSSGPAEREQDAVALPRMPGATVTESEPVGRILRHIGEPDVAPVITPTRGPPDLCLELDQSLAWPDDGADQVPEFEYDQTVSG
ncbi:MAG: hypothetical protein ABW185_03810 [Sedimenticola sp.]